MLHSATPESEFSMKSDLSNWKIAANFYTMMKSAAERE